MSSIEMLFVNTPDVTELRDIRHGILGVIFDVLDEYGKAIADQPDDITLRSSCTEEGEGKSCTITVTLSATDKPWAVRECETKLAREVRQYLPNDVNCTALIRES